MNQSYIGTLDEKLKLVISHYTGHSKITTLAKFMSNLLQQILSQGDLHYSLPIQYTPLSGTQKVRTLLQVLHLYRNL